MPARLDEDVVVELESALDTLERLKSDVLLGLKAGELKKSLDALRDDLLQAIHPDSRARRPIERQAVLPNTIFSDSYGYVHGVDPIEGWIRAVRLALGALNPDLVRNRNYVVRQEPTGWEKVDRGLGTVRKRLLAAQNEEDFQAMGLLCRETLISLAQEVYDQQRHGAPDGVDPSNTDAKRMLNAFFGQELAGGSNEEARKHAKASVALADALQHRRTASYRDAALCAEATESVVNLAAIIQGRRNAS